MRFLREDTAVDVAVGPFLDSTDGITPETALTITQPDILLKKGTGSWAQKSAAQTLSHESNGWYEVALSATDTDTPGHLMLAITESGALPVWHEFTVLNTQVYDSLFGALNADLLDVNVGQWLGTAAATPNTAGVPVVDDRTLRTNTATAGAASTITLDAGAPTTVDLYKGCSISIIGGTGVGQARVITAYSAGRVATITPAWVTNPASGSVFEIRSGSVNIEAILGAAASAAVAQLGVNVVNYGGVAGTFAAGRPEVNTSHWLGTAAQGATGRPQVDVELWLGVAPNALISGRLDVTVGAMQTDVITAGAIQADAIGSAALAASAITEIQSGLATSAALATVDANISTILAAVDTEILAIKAITDQFTFTGGRVNTNVEAINNNATAADNLERGARAAVLCLAVASGSSATVVVTNLTETTTDHYKDRTCLFTSGALAGQGRLITGYNGGTKALTVETLTETPADNDEIVIL
jgi:hypothetical protein